MTGMGQDALDDAVARYYYSRSIHTFAAEKRRVVESSFSRGRALAPRVEAAVVQDEDPSFRTCC